MKTFFKILLLAVFFTSCGEVEPTTFNGGDTGNVTHLSLSKTSYTLPVERDLTGSATVILNASTVSSVDRTYNVEVIVGDLPTSANPATFTVPSTIVIPANEYQGIIVIEGVDNGLVDATKKDFTIKISDASITNESIDGTLEALVSIYEVCELQSPFTGQYMMTQVSGFFGPVSQQGNTYTFEPGIVQITMGDTAYDRKFTATVYPGFGFPDAEVILSFACDFVNWGGPRYVGPGGCTEGNTIKFDATESPSMYDTTDDSVFEFTFSEDDTNSCNARRDVTFRFTKIN